MLRHHAIAAICYDDALDAACSCFRYDATRYGALPYARRYRASFTAQYASVPISYSAADGHAIAIIVVVIVMVKRVATP